MRGHQFTQTSQGQDILSAWREGVTEVSRSPELIREVGGRERELLPRFAEHYKKLRALPRRVRRAMQRKWKQSLAGVALLMTLGVGPAQAGTTINVGASDVAALIQAINDANSEVSPFDGPDTIVLANSTFTLTAVNNTTYGPTGLPVIASEITIDGNGSTIMRMSGAPDFRIFGVDSSGNLTLQETTVSGGKTSGDIESGGGVYNFGVLTVTNSTISGNSTSGDISGGGGVYNFGTMTVTNSTISGNSTSSDFSDGGGVYNFGFGALTVTNSTISGNSTSGNYSRGSGVSSSGTLTITDSTISGNSTSGNNSNGGGVFNGGTYVPGTLTLTRTLISGNTVALGSGSEVHNNGSVTTNAFNLFGHSGLTTADALYGVTPGATDITTATSDGTMSTALANILDTTLQNNGGTTQTHALVGGSPAVDAVTDGSCPPPDTDQRGVIRPQGAACDIGAIELQPEGGSGGGCSVAAGSAGFSGATANALITLVSAFAIGFRLIRRRSRKGKMQ